MNSNANTLKQIYEDDRNLITYAGLSTETNKLTLQGVLRV